MDRCPKVLVPELVCRVAFAGHCFLHPCGGGQEGHLYGDLDIHPPEIENDKLEPDGRNRERCAQEGLTLRVLVF